MTADDRHAEMLYRVTERLGILCGNAVPTKDQRDLAWREAKAWSAAWHAENDPPTTNPNTPPPAF